MGGWNSARSASTLRFIDISRIINSISGIICSGCLPRRFWLFRIKIFSSNKVYITNISAETISIIECAKNLTNFILITNTRVCKSACRDINNSAKCSCCASSIELLNNRTLSKFYILIKGKLLDVIDLLIFCITHVEFADNICFNDKFLAKRRRNCRSLRSKSISF